MLIIDETLLPLMAVFTLLDEFARLRKLRNVGDLSDASPISSLDSRWLLWLSLGSTKKINLLLIRSESSVFK